MASLTKSEKDDNRDSQSPITTLPAMLTIKQTGLSKRDHAILEKKQRWLQTYLVALPKSAKHLACALNSTALFAQEEAGTAVCIAPEGILLTCSHCVAEDAEALDFAKDHWLVFASGHVVRARTIAWDPKKDLALIRITEAQKSEPTDGAKDKSPSNPTLVQSGFPSIGIGTTTPAIGTKLVCIGHPGSEDLEIGRPGVKTGYDVLHVSEGKFRGYAEGQDLQDNSEIGALMHDCWTYWGHSGAPLVEVSSGKLAGLHSSWDDETCMRRGVPLEAIKAFLEEHDLV